MSRRTLLFVGTLVALFLAGVVSLYASSQPDGLAKVAGDTGFLDSAERSATSGGPLAGYDVTGVSNERASGAVAGVVGVAATAAAFGGLYLVIRRRPQSKAPADVEPDAEPEQSSAPRRDEA